MIEFQLNAGSSETPVEELAGKDKVKPPVVKLQTELQVTPLSALAFQ
jgi:hypothetical protein